jgi:hypothetical protein
MFSIWDGEQLLFYGSEAEKAADFVMQECSAEQCARIIVLEERENFYAATPFSSSILIGYIESHREKEE